MSFQGMFGNRNRKQFTQPRKENNTYKRQLEEVARSLLLTFCQSFAVNVRTAFAPFFVFFVHTSQVMGEFEKIELPTSPIEDRHSVDEQGLV